MVDFAPPGGGKPMPFTLSQGERAALEAAQAQRPKVRHWRRYQAVLLRAQGLFVKDVARALGCSEASVYNWTAAWRREGVAGGGEGVHPGAAPRPVPQAAAALHAVPPQAHPQAHPSPAP